MAIEQMTENAKVVLLLCGRFGAGDNAGVVPLTPKEFNELTTWLQNRNWGPEDLLNEANAEALNEPLAPVTSARIKTLLARGAAMALAVEKWTNKGLWVLCIGDQEYPQRLKQHLKQNAPPILYGAGERELLSHGGVAVVGSRNVDSDGQKFARKVGERAAECSLHLISGAAKGVDEIAMHGAFSSGGFVVGVLADSLLESAVSGKYRQGIRSGQLLLVSTYNPEARFTVGTAMGRNKYIYALADYAVVVNSGYQEGGTWAGAREELRREGGRPVFIRTGPGVPKGNVELLKIGGRPFPNGALEGNIEETLRAAVTGGTSAQVVAKPPEYASLFVEPAVSEPTQNSVTTSRYADVPATEYEAVKPLILQALDEPKKLDDLAKFLSVRKPQLKEWVERLIKEGAVEERTIKRSKKLAVRKQDEKLIF